MGTIVSFHAHPDDEAIASGGTLARAAAAGHRVVLVFATRGELGEPVPGVLEPGEQLAMRRSAECYASAAALGAKRVEFLGFTDSGMMGEPSNDAPFCFWQADVEYAARTPRRAARRGGARRPHDLRRQRRATATPTTSRCTAWASGRVSCRRCRSSRRAR